MTTPAPSFTPGDWRADADDKLNPDRAYGIVRDLDPSQNGDEPWTEVIAEVCAGQTAEADARVLAAAKRLYAYAKAEALFFAWMTAIGEDEYEAAQNAYMEHVVSLGWHDGSDAGGFLNKLRAAALAQAEGRNT